MEEKRDKRIFSCVGSGIMIGVAAPLLYVAVTTKYPRALKDPFKPTYFPAGVLAFVIVVCAILFAFNLYGLLRERKIRIAAGETIGRFIPISLNAFITLAGTVLYGYMWQHIGFSLSSAIFMILISKKLEPARPWKQVVPVSLATVLIIYLLFVFVFKVPFPEPILNPIIDSVLYR